MPLVEDARLLPRNTRARPITRDELMSQRREQAILDAAVVKRAYLVAATDQHQRPPERRA